MTGVRSLPFPAVRATLPVPLPRHERPCPPCACIASLPTARAPPCTYIHARTKMARAHRIPATIGHAHPSAMPSGPHHAGIPSPSSFALPPHRAPARKSPDTSKFGHCRPPPASCMPPAKKPARTSYSGQHRPNASLRSALGGPSTTEEDCSGAHAVSRVPWPFTVRGIAPTPARRPQKITSHIRFRPTSATHRAAPILRRRKIAAHTKFRPRTAT